MSDSCINNIVLNAYVTVSLSLSLSGSIALVDIDRFFSFLMYTQSVGVLGRGISHRKVATYTHRTTQTQISMHRVEFEPTIPMFERAKTVHALDRPATVIDVIQPRMVNSIQTVVMDLERDGRVLLEYRVHYPGVLETVTSLYRL
jgi:hypothetical protein